MVLASQIQASSLNAEARTVEAVAYAGAPVESWDGVYHLSLSTGAVDLSRVKAGAGVFLDHDHSVRAQVGVIEDAWLVADQHLAMRIKFAKDEQAEQYFQGVQDGIYQNLSIGAFVLRKKDVTPETSARKEFQATKWQPFEVSLVGVPADPKARFLSQEEAPECELEESEVQGNSAPDQQKEVPPMEQPITGQTQAPPNPEAILAAERQRVSEIQRIGATAKLPAGAITAAVTGGTTIEAFKDQVLAHLMTSQTEAPTQIGAQAATIVRDQRDTTRTLMASAIMHRVDPRKNSVEADNDFRSMSLMRMAEESLIRAGVSVRGKAPHELAILAMQQTADFPYVLENSARKMLQQAYEYQQPTYRAWTKRSTTPDFKTMSRPRLGETPKFLVVPEGAAIQIGNLSESREQYAIATYGRGVSFTRQMLINDDLGAFNSLIAAFGVQAAILENKTVYAILNTNGNMSDSKALFHADHGNLGSGAIGNTALDAMFTAMAIQKGVDAVSVLNIAPKFLIVPAAKASTAAAALTAIGPNVKASDQNWFAGRLTVVSDAELDGTSTAVWYGAADPTTNPGIEYAHLEGAEGPQIIREENSNGILGITMYAYLDFGAKALDWRPLYKSTGV